VNFCLDARAATDHFPGVGRYVSSLAQALAGQLEAGETLTLLQDPTAATSWRLPEPCPGRVRISDMPASLFGLTQQLSVRRLLRRLDVDSYHSPYYLMPYRAGPPTVVTLYDLIAELFPEYVSRRARLLFRATTRLALSAAREVITISEASRRDLLARYRLPSERVTVIPLAPAEQFAPQEDRAIRRVRDRYDLRDYVLYVGINKPHKNLVRLVEAWQRVETDAQLVIAGAWDPRYPEPKRRASSLGIDDRVTFLGPVDDDDLPALYAGARLFVFPSLYEGFGLPVIEAMACGTPVACANTSSLPEVAGDAAALFDPHDAAGIAAVVGELLANEALRLKHRSLGLTRAAGFSWSRAAAATLGVYRRVAAGPC
jgi:glycosyltransferase involved in cell wall biosynthesis